MLSSLQAPFYSFFLMYVHRTPNIIFQHYFHYFSSVPPNQKQVTCLLVIVLNPYFLRSQKTFPCFWPALLGSTDRWDRLLGAWKVQVKHGNVEERQKDDRGKFEFTGQKYTYSKRHAGCWVDNLIISGWDNGQYLVLRTQNMNRKAEYNWSERRRNPRLNATLLSINQ